jgi:hypothetical protein
MMVPQRKTVVLEPMVYGYIGGTPYFSRHAYFDAIENGR